MENDAEVVAFWENIGSLLNENGRVDVMACDVGAWEEGEELLISLENLTGSNVAASTDATGNEELGGNWVLESDNIDLIKMYFNKQKLQTDFNNLLGKVPLLIGDAFKVNDYLPDFQGNVTAATLNDVNGNMTENFVVVWHSEDQNNQGYDIYYRVYNQNGDPVSNEILVNQGSHTSDNQYYAEVTALEKGGFVVVWKSYGHDGSGAGIFGKVYSNNGSIIKSEFNIPKTTTSDQDMADVTALDNGGFIVTWESWHNNTTTNTDIYAQIYNSSGVVIKEEFRVNTTLPKYQTESSVCSYGDGKFIVTWESYMNDGKRDIRGQRYLNNGTPIGTEFTININSTTGEQFRPASCELNNGDFVVAWIDGGSDSLKGKITAQRFDGTTGEAKGSKVTVNSNTTSNNPVLAPTDDGFVVVWQQTASDGKPDIYAQYYDFLGSKVETTCALTPIQQTGKPVQPSSLLGMENNLGHGIHYRVGAYITCMLKYSILTAPPLQEPLILQ